MAEKKLNIFEKIRYIITSPIWFFQYISAEASVKPAIADYLLLNLMILPFGAITAVLFNMDSKLAAVLSYMLGQAMAIVLFFLIILFYHIFILVFGGKQGLLKTYLAYIYGAIPALLVSWIPLVNVLVGVYSICLTIIGLMTLHKMKKGKAIAAYLISMLLSAIVIMIMAFVVSYITFGSLWIPTG